MKKDGVHDCSTEGDSLPLHLDHDLPATCEIPADQTPIKSYFSEAALSALGQQADHEIIREWNLHEVDRMDLALHKSSTLSTADSDGPLLYLLAMLNRAGSEATQSVVRFTGLKIRSCTGRRDIIPISDSNNEIFCPLIILHIGSDRILNAIPTNFLSDTKECFSIKLKEFSTVIVPPSTKKRFRLNLPNEGGSDSQHGEDHHILIVPFMAALDEHADAEQDLVSSMLASFHFRDTPLSTLEQSLYDEI